MRIDQRYIFDIIIKEKEEVVMKRKLKMILATVTLGAIVTTFILSNSSVFASEFEGNELYWTDVCSTWQTDEAIKQKCVQYNSYLHTKANEKINEATKAQEEIDSMQGDIEKLSLLSIEYTNNVAAINGEIASINNSIAASEEALSKLQTEISEQEEVVDARLNVVLDRMVDLQVIINTNKYVNILMGAEDFVSFIQKTKSVGEFTEQDNEKISELNEAIAKLETDKEEQNRIKEMQEVQKSELVAKQEDAKAIADANEEVYARMLNQSDNLATARDGATAEANSIGGLIPSVPAPPYVPPIILDENGEVIEDGGDAGGSWGSAQANFYDGWFDSSRNIFSAAGYTGQCTWYVYGRANQQNGGAYRGLPTGNASEWISQAQARGMATGNTPRSNAIMVWSTNYFGHVAYIESFDGETIRVSEGNINAPGGGLPMHTSLETAIMYTMDSTMPYSQYISFRGTPIGFIYL